MCSSIPISVDADSPKMVSNFHGDNLVGVVSENGGNVITKYLLDEMAQYRADKSGINAEVQRKVKTPSIVLLKMHAISFYSWKKATMKIWSMNAENGWNW